MGRYAGEATGNNAAATRHTSEPTCHTGEAVGHTGDATRHTGEATRHTGEATRHAGEATRHAGEAARHTGEAARHTGETTRHTGETTRHTGETTRHTNPPTRHDNHAPRHDNHAPRRAGDGPRRNGDGPRDPARRPHVAIAAVPDVLPGSRIELRQLRYFVTLAEELHFGRAAAREHIAPSALTQHVQRLERALGVLLVDRANRQVTLTTAGARFLIEVREILDHVDRAATLAQGLAAAPPTLRVGVLDEGYEAVRPILRAVHAQHPDLEIHQVQAGVPEQCRMLADGRLDIGVGRACAGPLTIASELFRLDPLGVLVAEEHHFARLPGVPVAALKGETLLLADEERAPEFNEFVAEVCRAAGFFPARYHGSVQTLRAAADLVAESACVLVVPAASAGAAGPGLRWLPLVPAVPRYPWSLMWRAQNPPRGVDAVVAMARRLSVEHGWRQAPAEIAS